MSDPIRLTVPGSFAELMSQSPPPSIHKHEKMRPRAEIPAKAVTKSSGKEALDGQIPRQANEDTSSTQKKINGINHNVATSSLHEVTLRVWKDTIENTETHNSSLRLTNEENYAVEDLINELKRNLKVKASLNEVARLGLLYIIHDFKQNREKSLVYKVKKS